MFEENLLQYGIAGIFIIYLMYDRQVIIKSLQSAIELNTTATNSLIIQLKKK